MYDDTERQRRIDDGAALLRHVLGQAHMHPDLVRRVLLEVFWFVSEANGKYRTRFESEGSVALRTSDPTTWRSVRQHEHVFTRRSLSQRLREGEDPEAVLQDAFGCVVTKDEHALLGPFDLSHEGWDRYREAGVHVMDHATEQRVL